MTIDDIIETVCIDFFFADINDLDHATALIKLEEAADNDEINFPDDFEVFNDFQDHCPQSMLDMMSNLACIIQSKLQSGELKI